MHFTAGLPYFYKSCSKKIGLNMILVHWLSQVIQNTFTKKFLVEISPVEMELMFSEIYPESMSEYKITEKNII